MALVSNNMSGLLVGKIQRESRHCKILMIIIIVKLPYLRGLSILASEYETSGTKNFVWNTAGQSEFSQGTAQYMPISTVKKSCAK